VESTGNLVIRGLQEGDQLQWDEFVEHHEHGSPFHLMAWKRAVEESFKNFKPMYMLVADGDHIRAVLPLFLVKNMIVGKALLSSPFAVYGGILAETSDIRDKLYELSSAWHRNSTWTTSNFGMLTPSSVLEPQMFSGILRSRGRRMMTSSRSWIPCPKAPGTLPGEP
jgi:hypothetical protein